MTKIKVHHPIQSRNILNTALHHYIQWYHYLQHRHHSEEPIVALLKTPQTHYHISCWGSFQVIHVTHSVALPSTLFNTLETQKAQEELCAQQNPLLNFAILRNSSIRNYQITTSYNTPPLPIEQT